MEQKEFRIKSYDGEFRIKKMNAIELLGIRSQIDFDNLDSAIEFFKIALEHIEVKIGNDWVPVKMKNREVYLPDGLENDIMAVNELTNYFTKEFLMPVFLKSSESKA